MIPDFKTYIGESTWGDMRKRSSGEMIRKENQIKTNGELKEMIDNLYEEQGEGDTLDVTSIALGKRYICDDLSELFDGYSNVTRIIGLNTWDVNNVTNMSSMFYACKSLTELNIDNWDVSKVTNMDYMFGYCEKLTKLNIDNWDVNNATNMRGMFSHSKTLEELNIDNWNVSKVTDICYMFSYCINLTELNIDNWNVSNVTDMNNMFGYCTKLYKEPKWYK